mgnify:CR=1 FL=1
MRRAGSVTLPAPLFSILEHTKQPRLQSRIGYLTHPDPVQCFDCDETLQVAPEHPTVHSLGAFYYFDVSFSFLFLFIHDWNAVENH